MFALNKLYISDLNNFVKHLLLHTKIKMVFEKQHIIIIHIHVIISFTLFILLLYYY